MRKVTVTWSADFSAEVEVDDDWVWDGELDSLLPLTDGMPFNDPSGTLSDWGVRS